MLEVLMKSDSICAVPDTISTDTVLFIEPVIIPQVMLQNTDTANCSGEQLTFVAIPIRPNPAVNLYYEWYVNGAIRTTGVDSIFSPINLENGDQVEVVMYVDKALYCISKDADTSAPTRITIYDQPNAGSITDNADVCFEEGEEVRILDYRGEFIWEWSEDNVNWMTLNGVNNQEMINVIPSDIGTHSELAPYEIYLRASVFTNAICDTVSTNFVRFTEYPPLVYDTSLIKDCENFELFLEATTADFTQFVGWDRSNNGVDWINETNATQVVREGVEIRDEFFRAQFINNIGCEDEVIVAVKECLKPIPDIPNAVTSNNDGNNDVFYIGNIEFFPNNKLWIYNRWGNLIYTAKGYDNAETAWDGTRNGEEMPAAVYYYILDLGDGTPEYKGTITLLRDEN